MAFKSTLCTNTEVKSRMYDLVHELGVKHINYGRLNLYASREAQRDGKPALSWEEASAAAHAYVERRPLTRLPGPAQEMTFTLEDGMVMGGSGRLPATHWQRILEREGELYGVQVEMSVIPGTLKKASRLARFFGATDEAQYRIELKGPKAQVERLVDTFHQAVFADWADGE